MSELDATGRPPVDDRIYFRAMKQSGNLPALGPKDLGVRIGLDVCPAASGELLPLTGGMSVAPDDPRNLHRIYRPESLGGLGKKPVWAIWRSRLPTSLSIVHDVKNPTEHALVEPSRALTVEAYQAALESTVPDWMSTNA